MGKRLLSRQTTLVMFVIFIVLFTLNVFYAINHVNRVRSIDMKDNIDNFFVVNNILSTIKEGRIGEIAQTKSNKNLVNFLSNFNYDNSELNEFLHNEILFSKYYKRLEVYDVNGNLLRSVSKSSISVDSSVFEKKNISSKNYYNEVIKTDKSSIFQTESSYDKNETEDNNEYKKYPTSYHFINIFNNNGKRIGLLKFDYYPKSYFDMLMNFSTIMKNQFYMTSTDSYGFMFNSDTNLKIKPITFAEEFPEILDKVLKSNKKIGLVFDKKNGFFYFITKQSDDYPLKEIQNNEIILFSKVYRSGSIYIHENPALAVLHYVLIENLALNLLILLLGIILNKGFLLFIDLVISKRNTELQRINDERYKIIVNHIGEIVFDWDIVNDKIFMSESFKEKFGYEYANEDFTSRLFASDRIYNEDKKDLKKISELVYKVDNIEKDFRIKDIDGKMYWFHISFSVIRNNENNPVRGVGIMIDVTNAKEAEKMLIKKAELDGLTQVYNRATFEEGMKLKLQEAEGHGTILYFGFFDIDDFKFFNDNYGHKVGDRVIKFVADTVSSNIKNLGICGRLGGDEFAILLNVQNEESCAKVLSSITKKLKEGIKIRESSNNIPVYCSIGLACYPTSAKTYKALIEKADKAMYEIKEYNKNCRKNKKETEDYKLL